MNIGDSILSAVLLTVIVALGVILLCLFVIEPSRVEGCPLEGGPVSSQEERLLWLPFFHSCSLGPERTPYCRITWRQQFDADRDDDLDLKDIACIFNEWETTPWGLDGEPIG